MIKINPFERMLATVSPKWAMSRARSRLAFNVLANELRNFEGAGRGRRTKNWKAPSTSANGATLGLKLLRDRARDLDRNDKYAKRANNLVSVYTVGTGIIPQTKGANRKQVDFMEAAWKEWGETTAIDVRGRQDFYGLSRKVMRTVSQSGHILVRRIPSRLTYIPFQIQTLDADLIDLSRNQKLSNGNRIVKGIEINKYGRILAGWLFEEHPGDSLGLPKSNRIPANELLSVLREDRDGQLHGVPWSAVTMLDHRDISDLNDAQLLRKKIAACFAAYIIDSNPDGEAEDISDVTDKIEPGGIFRLAPGKDIKTATPPGVDGHGEDMKTFVRGLAIGYDLTYESLTTDLSNVNFSSGRMGRIDLRMIVNSWRDDIMIPQFCQPVWEWFKQGLAIRGFDSSGTWCEWTAPLWEYLDPVKEAQGLAVQLRNGIKTLSQVIKETGRDPREHLEEISEMNALLDEMKIKLDSDARYETGASWGLKGQNDDD